jgi:hypothetical protein
MTESRAYITENLWFICEDCGEQITHHTMHDCFVMNPNILPTHKEWRLVCKMAKQHCELTDDEIKQVYGKYFDVKNCDWLHLECIRAILKKAESK